MTARRGYGWLLVLLIAASIPVVASDAVSVSINDNAQYTAVREISIKLAYSGQEAPTEMRIYATGAAEWSGWLDYTDSFNWVLPGNEGLTRIRIETRYEVESRTDTTVYSAWRVVAGESDIFLDMTPPVLTALLTPDATEYGWYNGPVSVVFQASDSGSGIATSPRDLRFNQEGEGQSVVREAVDKAGNRTEITVSGINIDLTPPLLLVSTPEPNENGWYNESVSVTYEISDSLSGLATTSEDRILGITGKFVLFPRAVDKAGNVTELPEIVANIDMDNPLIAVDSIDPGASADIWVPGPVTVTFASSDGLSGVDSIEYVKGAMVNATDGGEQISTAQVRDLAGNMSALISVGNINIDSALPTTTVLLADSEGASGANVHNTVLPIDLKAKLDAFGTYDVDSVALGYSFADANLKIYVTLVKVGEAGASDSIHFYQSCEYAPTGGFYYFVLPANLVSGNLYEVWFEEIGGSHVYRAQVIAP